MNFSSKHFKIYLKHFTGNTSSSIFLRKKLKLPVAMLLWHYQCPYFHLRTVRMAHPKLNQQYLVRKISIHIVSWFREIFILKPNFSICTIFLNCFLLNLNYCSFSNSRGFLYPLIHSCSSFLCKKILSWFHENFLLKKIPTQKSQFTSNWRLASAISSCNLFVSSSFSSTTFLTSSISY